MLKVLSVLFLIGLTSCEKDQFPQVETASYSITVTGKWQLPQFTVPANVHFTYFAGMVHDRNSMLWKEGTNASSGIENVAEIGGIAQLILEVDAYISTKKAIAHIAFPPPAPTGSITSNVYLTSEHSYVSFASMIAPSPDWFVGVNSVNLYAGGEWVSDTLINLYVYDAGTEDGDVFSGSNPATVPQQPIMLLTPAKATVLANGNTQLAPIATVRFRKL